MKYLFSTAAAITLALTMVTAADASTLAIKFTGLDLIYTGLDLSDAASPFGGSLIPADADPIASVEFLLDGSPLGTYTTDVYADLGQFAVPSSIPTGGGSTTWALGGFLDIFSSTLGWNLRLDLLSMTLGLAGGSLNATAAGGGIFGQSLPFPLIADQPVTVALALTTSNVTTSGGFVTGFDAVATGQINAAAVPEPSSMLLLGTGVAALVRTRLRRRAISES